MSALDELIQSLCPDGVEYKALRDVARRNKGTAMTAARMRAVHVNGAPIKIFAAGNTTATVHVGVVPATSVIDEPSVIVKSRGHIGFAYCDEPFTHKNELWSYTFKDEVDTRFAYHFLATRSAALQEVARSKSVKLPQLSTGDTDDLLMPMPPLEVQRAVAGTLDTMEELVGEVEAELEARALQYTHYRDFLISGLAHGEVKKQRFGDVATIVRGASPRPIQEFLTDDEDGVNWIKIGDVPATGKYVTRTAQRIIKEGASRSRRVQPGDFILSNSMSFGRPYIVQIDGFIHDGWLAIKDFDEHLDRDFLYHLLRSSTLYAEMASRAGSGTVKNLNADIVKSLELPIPSLARQRSIAEALDKFDALVNDPSSGLPAEIAARRKQFEYYRDLLLTFPEKSAA